MIARRKGLPAYQAKEQLCWLARELSARHLLGYGMGSLSICTAEGEIWVTPTEGHPALLTTGRLLRLGADGKLYGPGTLDAQELLHHLRIYRQVPQAGAVLVLSPVYQDLLRRQDTFPELPSGPVNLDIPLCDRGRSLRAILWQERLICWGDSLTDAFLLADRVDRDCYSRCFSPPSGAQLSADKVRLMEQVATAVAKSIQNQRKGGDGLLWS